MIDPEAIALSGTEIGCLTGGPGKWTAYSLVDNERFVTPSRDAAIAWLGKVWKAYHAKGVAR